METTKQKIEIDVIMARKNNDIKGSKAKKIGTLVERLNAKHGISKNTIYRIWAKNKELCK